jgi:hypothetical protein
MTSFSDLLSSACHTTKNVVGQGVNFIGKVEGKIGSFIPKAALMGGNIVNFMNNLPGKLGTIGKTINNVADRADSMAGCYHAD